MRVADVIQTNEPQSSRIKRTSRQAVTSLGLAARTAAAQLMPRVLNLRDFPDGVPNGAIYCGSPMRQRRLSGSPFANPFKLRRNATEAERTECVAMYERWLMMQPALLTRLRTLAGSDLACWCAPLPCHCDVLVRLANGAE